MKNFKFLFLLIPALLLSCRKSNTINLIEVDVNVDIIDKSGKSIVEEEVTKGIHLYNYDNEKKTKVYNPDLEAKHGYVLIPIGLAERKLLRIFPTIPKDGLEQSMLLEFADAKVDTLKFVYSKPYQHTIHCVKIFLNHKEVWHAKTNTDDPIARYFEIIH